MPLARLENFLKNLNGNTLYVDPNELDASDSIENRGNSKIRPFKTIQRALIEAARFSYIPGPNNDLFDQTTILIAPGTHFIDNRPGFYVDQNQVLRDANNITKTISELNISSNFELDDPANILYTFNSADGGVILPKGTSLVATDLRKTKIKPKFIPNPINDLIAPSAIFRLTGACYIYGFTIFDGDPVGKVYSNYTTNTSVPNFSHHKLTAFEYADDRNTLFRNGADTGYTDLQSYYYKLSLAYGSQSGRSVIDGFTNFQPSVDENRIVGELGVGSISILSAVSGNGTSGTNVITVQTQTPHDLSPLTPILISGLGQDEGPTSELEYNGNFVVAQVTSATEFTYLLSNVPTQTLNPSVSGATIKVISDTVSSASPYIYNCSLKSVYGMNGIHADGSKVSGFKSVVTAQFTGISLQKDDRAFVEYDESVGGYNYQENYGVDKFLHQSSRSKYRPSWESFHVKASNNAFIQCVSIFAIGYAKQFVTESGGDQSITNSNSNFGSISLFSTGFKDGVLPKDNHAYITHIIPPKDISSIETEVRYVDIDASLTSTKAPSNQYTRVYLKGYVDLLDPPPSNIKNFVLGGKQNDIISYKRANDQYSIPINPSYKSEYDIVSIDTDTNIVALSSVVGISTGISGKIISGTGELPDGISANKLYTLRLTGGNGVRLFTNLLNAETDTSPVDIKNVVGLTTSNLKFVSKISEKKSGDVGSPVQWDEVSKNWYVGVNSVGAGATDFFSNLLGVTAPGTFFSRKVDSRFNKDKLYKIRIVIPKESENSSDLSSGFIIQKASNSLDSVLYQADSEQLSSINPVNQARNDGAIVDAWYSAGTVTIVTSKPHKLNVGDVIEVYNLKSSNEPSPVGLGTGTGYNGRFTVANVINEIRFTYSISRNPGTITQGTSSVQTWLSERNCAQTSNYRIPPYTIYDSNRSDLPYFKNKKLINDYQLYDIETIQEYVEGTTDGIYHVILNAFKNTPSIAPFNTDQYKLSQSIEKLYPIQDLDNPISDPEATITIASRKEIGTVTVDDDTKSVTKETLTSYLRDFNLTSKITGITTYYDSGTTSGIATVTTSIPHGLGGIRRLTVTTPGSGYINGLYYDIPLCDGNGVNATANIRVTSNQVEEAFIQNQGSGYVSGDLLRVRGIPGSTNDCFLTVSSVNYSPTNTDTIQILGCAKKENNGTFVIQSVKSNTITYYNNNASPETPSTAVAFLSGNGYQIRNSPDGSIYNPSTDVTTITTQQPHPFVVGSKVIFDDAIGNPAQKIGICTVSTVTGITTFTVKGNAENAIRVFGAGLLPNPKDTSADNENLSSRHFTILGGYKGSLSQAVTASTSSFLLNDLYGLDKGDFIQVNSEIMFITRISGGEVYVKRGLFGTRSVPHENNSSIKKIKIVPIELRRNSIIRASGHTFEYTGFGPGNYSTGMPTNQDRILSDNEVLNSQSLNTRGGLVVYTGMNSDGEFYIGKTKFDAVTGKQIDVGIPEAESSNNVNVDVLIANKIIINDEIDATTAGANINNIIVSTDAFISGIATIASTVNSIDPSSGGLVVLGGLGVNKDVNIGQNIKVNGNAQISAIRIGIASTSTIDTLQQNLYLNSAGGNTIIDDNVHISGNIRVAGISTFVSNISAGASITSVGDIVAGTGAQFKGYGTIPIGGIIMWSGAIVNIPTGWSLCNGSNGTPDLRDRFVIGASTDVAGITNTTVTGSNTKTGGTKDLIVVSHSHTGTTAAAGSHLHTGSTSVTGSHQHTGTTSVTGSHQHTGPRCGNNPGPLLRQIQGFGADSGTYITDAAGSHQHTFTSDAAGDHQHTFTSSTAADHQHSFSTSTEGSSGANQNLPPYYALAFIMRTL